MKSSLTTFENVHLFAFLFNIAIISGVTTALSRVDPASKFCGCDFRLDFSQPVSFGEAISDLTLAVKSHYRMTTVSQMKYTSQQNNGRQNGLTSRMLFSEMQKTW